MWLRIGDSFLLDNHEKGGEWKLLVLGHFMLYIHNSQRYV